MARYAPVAPIQILEAMKQDEVLGRYHLLLTHHILEFPERFHNLFEHTRGYTIIVDNSIVELGDAASDEKVLEACRVLQQNTHNPNYIIPVLKDVMGDGPATIEAADASYKWWVENTERPRYNMMVVAQGNSWESFTKTVDHFLTGDYPEIGYVGIPRVLVKYLGTRQKAIEYVDAVAPNIAVHLLGFSDDVTDDIICANMPCVEGIDSAVPLRYAYSATEGESLFYTPSKEIPPRPASWFEDGRFLNIDAENLYNIRRWVS